MLWLTDLQGKLTRNTCQMYTSPPLLNAQLTDFVAKAAEGT